MKCKQLVTKVINKLIYPITSSLLVDMKLKKNAYKLLSRKIQTLVLGSSHGEYGFNPDFFLTSESFNLCSTSQDLYYSFSLLKRNIKKMCSCTDVIIFYSVFSSGFELQRTSEKYRCSLYTCFWGISLKTYSFYLSVLSVVVYFVSLFLTVPQKDSYRGYIYNPSFLFGDNTEDRVEKHIKHNKRINADNERYMREIIFLSKKYSKNLFFVIPPTRQDYGDFCLAKGISCKSMINEISYVTLSDNITILNYFNNNVFSNDLFGDSDHLNADGARILTTMIQKDIELAKKKSIKIFS